MGCVRVRYRNRLSRRRRTKRDDPLLEAASRRSRGRKEEGKREKDQPSGRRVAR